MRHYDTSAYAFDAFTNPECMCENFSGYDVEDFVVTDYGQPDSIFGLGNKKKQAERKLARAEKQLDKGHVKRATKLQSKAQSRLNKIGQGQLAQSAAAQQLSDVNTNQGVIGQQLEDAKNVPAPAPLSAQPMSSAGSDSGLSSDGSMSMTDTGIGADSTAPETTTPSNTNAISSDTTTAKKSNVIIYVIVAVAVIALFMFGKKLFK